MNLSWNIAEREFSQMFSWDVYEVVYLWGFLGAIPRQLGCHPFEKGEFGASSLSKSARSVHASLTFLSVAVWL